MLKSNLLLFGELYKLREEGSYLDDCLVGIDGKSDVHLPVLIAANPCTLLFEPMVLSAFRLRSLIGNTTNSTDGRLLLDAHCSTAAAADLTAVRTD